jgi:hypothetical protein
MAFTAEKISKGAKTLPRKVIIYGPPKVGKSSLAGSAKNALMIPTEDRVAHIKCDKAPVVKDYSEILEIFDYLITKKHSYKRVILDSLDWCEPLIHAYICKKKGLVSLTDDNNKETAFQKGLKYLAVEAWKGLLYNCDVLRDHGMDVIVVAHSTTITVMPPNMDNYEKAVMKIDKNALSVVEEWADVIAFYTQEIFVKKDEKTLQKKGKAITSKKRILHLSGENPAMINGNSFGLGDVEVSLEFCQDIMEWMLTANEN